MCKMLHTILISERSFTTLEVVIRISMYFTNGLLNFMSRLVLLFMYSCLEINILLHWFFNFAPLLTYSVTLQTLAFIQPFVVFAHIFPRALQ